MASIYTSATGVKHIMKWCTWTHIKGRFYANWLGYLSNINNQTITIAVAMGVYSNSFKF